MFLSTIKQPQDLQLKPNDLATVKKIKPNYNLTTQTKQDEYAHLNAEQKSKIDKKLIIINQLEALINTDISLHKSCLQLVEKGVAKCSIATLKRDFKKYKKGSLMSLKSKSFGTRRAQQDWEQKATELYLQTSKPNPNAIANMLCYRFGYESATYYRVTNFLKQFASNAPMRAGDKNHRLNMGRYKDRHTDNLEVGDCYMGDGHKMDIRIAHPTTGHPVRMELTAWIDVKSRYITGVYFEHDESSLGTLYSLSKAIDNYEHVPYMIYIDNGSGFKSKIMTDEHIGFYQRNNIETIFSIPGNPRGKAQIERFFRTFEQQCLSLLAIGYCGKEQDERSATLWFNKAKNKDERILSFNQLVDEVKTYIEQYNNQPHNGINGQTPAGLWQQLEKSPPIDNGLARTRPQVRRKVQHGGRIALHSRQYDSTLLVSLQGAEVIVEYSLLDDSAVDIFDLEHNFIANIELVRKVAMIPTSRIEEAKDNRLKGQAKRLDKKLKQVEQQSMPVIDAQEQATLQVANGIDLDLTTSTKQPMLIDLDISQLSTE